MVLTGVSTSFRPPRCFRAASGTRTVSICEVQLRPSVAA
ncbi:hypothetical protein GGQ83_001621 [Roseococcus suduntuyensis]|uniref:Uncharacterized protein n=1 Tax=Roseococcus suduntuyensis TaxID=455361 RepID=A0A840AD74_9PROT|nr:hypothetical protein [Roseococcus suduntuyensis]